MKFSKTVLDTIAYELGPEVWTSASIEQKLAPLYDRLQLPYGRIELMTGILERRFWPTPVKPSFIAAQAGKKALSQSKITPKQIDLLIYAGVSRDCIEPATAAYVHHLLQLPSSVQIFDLSNACLGFLNAMLIAGSMIENESIQSALILSGEDGRPLVENTIHHLTNNSLNRNEIKPFFANLTIGSGAVAAILTSDKISSSTHYFKKGIVCTDSASNFLCEGVRVNNTEYEMQTNSEKLLHAGIALAKKTWDQFQASENTETSSFNCTICHQVGQRHLNELYRITHLNPKNDFSTYPSLGNVGSASVPITLAMALEQGAIQKNNHVGLLGIGSGLSSMILSLQT